MSNVDYFFFSLLLGSDFCCLLYVVIVKFSYYYFDKVLDSLVQKILEDVLEIYIFRVESVQEYFKVCDLEFYWESEIEGVVKILELEQDVLEEYVF